MRFSPNQFLHGLLYTAPVLLLTLAACGGGGNSAAPVTIPAAPTGVAAVQAAGCMPRLQISWTGAAGATGYNLYRSAASGVTAVPGNLITATPVAASPYTDIGPLVKGITYYYVVTATNSAGEGTASSQANATTISTTCKNQGGGMTGVQLALANPASVTTFAGKAGTAGFTNATGKLATFSAPNSMTTDGVSLFVADTTNNAIRKIDLATGVVTTLAGSGAAGGAINAVGTLATFSGPKGITNDGTFVYVADTGNGTIRKIDISATATSTLATGFTSPEGITFDGLDLYVTDITAGGGTLTKVTTTAGTRTVVALTGGTLSAPKGITFDGLDFYVADAGTHTIVKITKAGVASTFAGVANSAGFADNATGTLAKFNLPQGITTDGTNLYVADTGNQRIRKIAISTAAVTTLAGSATIGNADGTGTSASFSFPIGITTDGTSLYNVDNGSNTIRKIQ